MILLLLSAQTMVHMPAPGLALAVPPTRFSCDLAEANGSRFTVSGWTPEFPVGWDPNSAKYVDVQSTHPVAFKGKVGIDPSPSGEWFREFQVAKETGGVRYTLNLMLRREGTSIGYTTRYESTGKKIPYEYHATGHCTADFGVPGAAAERGLR